METGDAASIPNVTDFVANLNPSYYFASRHIFLSGLCDGLSRFKRSRCMAVRFKVHEAARNGVGLRPRRIF